MLADYDASKLVAPLCGNNKPTRADLVMINKIESKLAYLLFYVRSQRGYIDKQKDIERNQSLDFLYNYY